jgi:preprotein translocase subunit SecB
MGSAGLIRRREGKSKVGSQARCNIIRHEAVRVLFLVFPLCRSIVSIMTSRISFSFPCLSSSPLNLNELMSYLSLFSQLVTE